MMSKNAKLLIGQICKLERMLHVMQCISFIKIPPHHDGFSLFYILLGVEGGVVFIFKFQDHKVLMVFLHSAQTGLLPDLIPASTCIT